MRISDTLRRSSEEPNGAGLQTIERLMTGIERKPQYKPEPLEIDGLYSYTSKKLNEIIAHIPEEDLLTTPEEGFFITVAALHVLKFLLKFPRDGSYGVGYALLPFIEDIIYECDILATHYGSLNMICGLGLDFVDEARGRGESERINSALDCLDNLIKTYAQRYKDMRRGDLNSNN